MVVSVNGKRIMFDCGMHMGYTDSRRYPDFSLISKTGDFDKALTCVIVTHLYSFIRFTLCLFQLIIYWIGFLMNFFSSHLDHIGALPYFTEVCGYKGPIYMTVTSLCLCIWLNVSLGVFIIIIVLILLFFYDVSCIGSIRQKHWPLWCWRTTERIWTEGVRTNNLLPIILQNAWKRVLKFPFLLLS